MPAPQHTWEQLVAQIASMQRIVEVGSSTSSLPNTYWTREDIELWLHEISQQLLRELPSEMLTMVGSWAVQLLTPASGDELPLNTVQIASATIKMTSGDTRWLPAKRCSIAKWCEHLKTPDTALMRYVLMEGKIFYTGDHMRLIVITEPELSDFQADLPILPTTGVDDMRIKWVHQMLTLQDFLPGDKI